MKIILLILAIFKIISTAIAHHVHKTEYFRNDPRFSKSINGSPIAWACGSVLSAAVEGICWWYVISSFIK